MKITKSVGENVLDVVEAMVLWMKVKFDNLKEEYYKIGNEGDFRQTDIRWMRKDSDKSQNLY